MKTEYDVCAIGNAIVDVIAKVDDQFIHEHGLVKGSMRLIDEAQAETLYRCMGPAVKSSGGSAANTVAGIAALGGKASFIGRVKNDSFGHVFRSEIISAGITYQTSAVDTGPNTACCYILVTPDGERTMNTFLGASVNFAVSDICEELVSLSAITYLEGYLWDKPKAKEAFIVASRLARAAGRKVALTLSDRFCVDRHRDSFLRLVQDEVDILFANEDEILSLYETSDFSEALSRAKSDCKLAAITRSELGSVIVSDGETIKVPARRVERVIDSTGSGDLYAAGFLFGLAHNLDFAACGQIGSFAAAEIIQQFGARPQSDLLEKIQGAGLL